mgnify:CR=1 FL=1
MKNLKKGLSILTFAFVMLISLSVVNVNAAEIKLDDKLTELKGGTALTITKDDTLTFAGETWIGENGRISLVSGDVTLKYENNVVNITTNNTVSVVNGGKQFIMQIDTGSGILPVKLTNSENSTLNVEGTLAIPAGSKGVLINEGTVNVYGNLEIRSSGTYTSTGTTKVYGNVAVLAGANTSGNIGNSIFTLYEKGNIYSEKEDISLNVANGLGDAYEIVSNNKHYVGNTTTPNEADCEYGYTLQAKEVEEVPVVPGEDETTQNNPTEEVKNEEVNPETSDGILLFLGLTVVGFAGTALAYRRLHN